MYFSVYPAVEKGRFLTLKSEERLTTEYCLVKRTEKSGGYSLYSLKLAEPLDLGGGGFVNKYGSRPYDAGAGAGPFLGPGGN